MGTRKEPKGLDFVDLEGVGRITVGLKVKHPFFGEGEVEDLFAWESGETIIRVMFKEYGSKALSPEYCKLTLA